MNQFNKILNKEIINLMRKNYNNMFFEKSESLITRIDANAGETKPYNRLEGDSQTSSIFITQNNFYFSLKNLNKNSALRFNDQKLTAFVPSKIGLGDLGGDFANVKALITTEQKFSFNMNKVQRNSSFLNLTKNFLSKRLGNQTLVFKSLLESPLIKFKSDSEAVGCSIENVTADDASLVVDASSSCTSSATSGWGNENPIAATPCSSSSPPHDLPGLWPSIRTWLRPTQGRKKKMKDRSTNLIKERSLYENKSNSEQSSDNDYFYYKLQSSQFEIIYLQLVKSNLEFSLSKSKGALAAPVIKQLAGGGATNSSSDMCQENLTQCNQSVPEKHSKRSAENFLFQGTNAIDEVRLFRVFDHSQINTKKYIFLQKSFQSQPTSCSSIETTVFSSLALESQRASGIEPPVTHKGLWPFMGNCQMAASLPIVSVPFLKTSTLFKRWATRSNSGAVTSTIATVRQPKEWKKRTDKSGHPSNINVLKFAHRDAVLFYWLIPFFGFVLSGSSKFNQLNSIFSNLGGLNYEQNLLSTERQISFYDLNQQLPIKGCGPLWATASRLSPFMDNCQVDPKSKLHKARTSKPFSALPKELQFGKKKKSLTLFSADNDLQVLQSNQQLYCCDAESSVVSSLKDDNNEILQNFFLRLKNKKEFNKAKMNWVWWVQRSWFTCSQSDLHYQTSRGVGARLKHGKVSPKSKLFSSSSCTERATSGTFDPRLKLKSFGFMEDFPSQMIKTEVKYTTIKNRQLPINEVSKGGGPSRLRLWATGSRLLPFETSFIGNCRKSSLFSSSSCASPIMIKTFAVGKKKAKVCAPQIKPLYSSLNKIIYQQTMNSSDLHQINPLTSKQKTKYLLNYFFQQLSWIKVIPPSFFTSVSEFKILANSGSASSCTERATASSFILSSPTFPLVLRRMREGSVSTAFAPEGEQLAVPQNAQFPASSTSLLNLLQEKSKPHPLMMKKHICDIVIELTKNLDDFYNLLLIQKGQLPSFNTSSCTSSVTANPFNLNKQLEFFKKSSNQKNWDLSTALMLRNSAVASLVVNSGGGVEDCWSSVIDRTQSQRGSLILNEFGQNLVRFGKEKIKPSRLRLNKYYTLKNKKINSRQQSSRLWHSMGNCRVNKILCCTSLSKGSKTNQSWKPAGPLPVKPLTESFLRKKAIGQANHPALPSPFIQRMGKPSLWREPQEAALIDPRPSTGRSQPAMLSEIQGNLVDGETELIQIDKTHQSKTFYQCVQKQINKMKLYSSSYPLAIHQYVQFITNLTQKNSSSFYSSSSYPAPIFRPTKSCIAFPSKSIKLKPRSKARIKFTMNHMGIVVPTVGTVGKQNRRLSTESQKIEKLFRGYLNFGISNPLEASLSKMSQEAFSNGQSKLFQTTEQGLKNSHSNLFFVDLNDKNLQTSAIIKSCTNSWPLSFTTSQLSQSFSNSITNSQSTDVDKGIVTIEKISKNANGQIGTKKLKSKEQLVRSQRRLDGFRLLLTNQKFFLKKPVAKQPAVALRDFVYGQLPAVALSGQLSAVDHKRSLEGLLPISQYVPSLEQLPVNQTSLNVQNTKNSSKSVFFTKLTFPSLTNLENNMIRDSSTLYKSLLKKHLVDDSAPGKQGLLENFVQLTLAKEFRNVRTKIKRSAYSSIITSYKKNQDLIHRYSLKKDQQKKRRAKKQNLKTRWAKKRKRFYPRPSWLRFRMYLRWLVTKTSFNSDPEHFLGQGFVKTNHPQICFSSVSVAAPTSLTDITNSGSKIRTDSEKSSFLVPILWSTKQKGQNRVLNERINYNLSNSVINDLYNIKKNKQNYLKTYFKRIRSTLNKIRQISNNINSNTKRFYIGRSKSIFSDFFTLKQDENVAKFIPFSSRSIASATQNLSKLMEHQEGIDSRALFCMPRAFSGLQISSKLDKKFLQKKNIFLSEYNRIIYLRLQNIIHRTAMDKIFDYSLPLNTSSVPNSLTPAATSPAYLRFAGEMEHPDKNQMLSKLNTKDNFSDLNEAGKIQNVGHRKLSSFLIEYSKRSSLLPQNAEENKNKRKIKTFLQETWIWLYNLGYGKTGLGAALSFEDSSSFGLDFFKIPNNIKNISLVWALNKTNNNSSQSFGGQHSRIDPQINYLWALQKLRNKSKNNKTKYLQKQFLNFFDSFLSEKQSFYFYRPSSGSLSQKNKKLKGTNNNVFSQHRNARNGATGAIKVDGSFVLLKERALPTVPMPLLSEKTNPRFAQGSPDFNPALTQTFGLKSGDAKPKSVQSNFLIKTILQKSKRKEQKLFYLGEKSQSSFLSKFSTNSQVQLDSGYLNSLRSQKAENSQTDYYSYLNNLNTQSSNFEIGFRKNSIQLNQKCLDEVVPSRPLRNNFHFWWTSTSSKPILNKQTVRFIYFIFNDQKSQAYASRASVGQTAGSFTIQNSIGANIPMTPVQLGFDHSSGVVSRVDSGQPFYFGLLDETSITTKAPRGLYTSDFAKSTIICLFFHFCALISVISLFQLRSYLKFYFLVVFKLSTNLIYSLINFTDVLLGAFKKTFFVVSKKESLNFNSRKNSKTILKFKLNQRRIGFKKRDYLFSTNFFQQNREKKNIAFFVRANTKTMYNKMQNYFSSSKFIFFYEIFRDQPTVAYQGTQPTVALDEQLPNFNINYQEKKQVLNLLGSRIKRFAYFLIFRPTFMSIFSYLFLIKKNDTLRATTESLHEEFVSQKNTRAENNSLKRLFNKLASVQIPLSSQSPIPALPLVRQRSLGSFAIRAGGLVAQRHRRSLPAKQNYAKAFYDQGLLTTKELVLLEKKVDLYLESKLFLKFVKLLFLGTTKMKLTLTSINKAKFLLLDSLFFVPISCFNFLTESFENLLKSIYNFYKKPTELTLDWMAYIFLIEWSCDSITFIPENTESFFWTSFKKNGMNSIMSRNLWFGTLLDFFASCSMPLDRIASNYLMTEVKERFPKILAEYSNNKVYYTAETEKQTYGWISRLIENSLINFFVTSFLHRRLFFIFSHFIQTLNQPDSDLLVRQKKGTIYWDIWAEILIKAADKYNIIIPSLTNLKDEQTKLIDSLYLEQISKIHEVSKNQNLKQEIIETSFKIEKSQHRQESNATIFIQNENRKGSEVELNKAFKKFYRPTVTHKRSLQRSLEGLLSCQLAVALSGQMPMNFNFNRGIVASSSAERATNGKYKMNLSEEIGRSVNQFITYQGKDTDLFINLYPPKSFSHISSIKYYNQIHQPIATLICSIYSGIFYKQTAKNILVIGSSNTEKTLLIEAIAGETELKIITDNANRYTFVKSGVAVGIKLLRDVFDAIAFHTPCLFLIEDIHVLGERRPLLISDDENSEVNKNGLSKDSESLEIHEKNQLMYQLSRHIITHYKKPYKGEFSLLIPTNHFSFDLFSFSRQGTLGENQIKNKTKQSPIENTTQGTNGETVSNTIPTLEGGQNQLSETSKNIYPTRLLLKSDKLLAPPATSPFTIFVLKEQKKFKSKKLVKELPLNGLSTEQLALFPKHSYSIRIKVAILAEDALLNLSAKLDMITDLLVIIDNVRGNRGFVVFATTHIPSILDPALRRPGRLDETISIPKVQNIWSRWEILKTNLQNFFSAPSRIYPNLDFLQRTEKNNQDCFGALSRCLDKQSYYRSKVKPNIVQNQVSWANLSTIDLIGSSKWNSNFINFPMLAFYNSYNKLNFPTAGHNHNNNEAELGTNLQKVSTRITSTEVSLTLINQGLKVGSDEQSFYSDLKKHNLSMMSLWKTKIKAIIYFSIGKKLIIPKFYYTPQSWQTSQWGMVYDHTRVNQKGLWPFETSFMGNCQSAVALKMQLSTNLDSKIKSQSFFLTNVNESTSNMHMHNESARKSALQLALLSSVSSKTEMRTNEAQELTVIAANESLHKIKTSQTIKANLSKLLSNSGNGAAISLDLSIDQLTLESQFATLYSNEGTLKGLLTRLFAGKISESFAFSNVCSESFSFINRRLNKQKTSYSENQQLHVKCDSESFDEPSLTNSPNSKFKKTRQLSKPIFNRFQMVYGIDESWKASTSLIFSLIKKRYLYRKNIIISSLLDFDNSTMNLGEPPSPPGSTILIPGKRYENYKRAMNAFEKKSNISIGEKIQIHQQQRFIKRLYNLIVPSVSEKPNKISKKLFFSLTKASEAVGCFSAESQDNQVANIDSAKRLGPIQEYCNKTSSVNWYFRKKILNRHRHYLTNQWWNMQFPEHNPEAVFLSDVDWRYTFIDSIGELLIDFPDAEQIYNSNERRWMLTSGYWNSWFNFNNNEVSYKVDMKAESNRTGGDIINAAQSFDLADSVSPEAIMNHFIVESFTQAFNWLDKNRELLDYSSYKLQKKGFLKETTLINSFKRFQFFSLS